MIRHSLIVLAIMTSTASAQAPGDVPSDPSGAPAQATPPQPPQLLPFDLDANLDSLIAKVDSEAPTIETVARGTLRRARRALSIGPTIGLWTAQIVDPGDLDTALTFGLGLELFKVPVLPGPATIKALIIERVKAQAKERLKAAFTGRPVEPFEAEQIIKQIYEDVRRELLGLENVRAKTMERPRLTFGIEANRLFGAERWLGRTRIGMGVWKLTVALSVAAGRVCRGGTCDDAVKLFTGPELVVHFLTSKQPRASVVDAFLRWDIQATGRGVESYDQVVLGARFLLDVM